MKVTPPTPPSIAASRSRVAGAALALSALLLTSCNKADQKPAKSPPPRPVPVSVAKAEQRDVPIELRSVGTVESIASVTIRPQIAGQVKEIAVGEGRDVKAGDLILSIDPRPFEAALREAEASLAKNQAISTDERRAAQQLRGALEQRAVSLREVEQAEAKAASAEAQIVQDQAAIETAKLQLSYCTITAPFAGRLGAFMVKPGAIVKENETPLIDLTQVAPIDISFTIREQDLAALRAANAKSPLQVLATIPGDSTPAQGQLSFIDNRVDPNTGAIRLKARYDNHDERLWPGQFVNVTVTLGHDAGATVVPSTAVQASQRGQAIFVIKGDAKNEPTAEMRSVAVRRTLNGISVIDSGVAPGETVVTDGQLRLTNGAVVAIKSDTPAAAPSPAPATSAPQPAAGAAK